jgi:hypothetical protein
MSEVEQTDTVEEVKETKKFRIYKEEKLNLMLLDANYESERYRPDAQELGEAFGVGTFYVFEVKEDMNYIYGNRTVVQATTYYSERFED